MPFYSTMRENFYPKYVKAPFLVKHKDKFIGSDRKDFFTTSERSTVVSKYVIVHTDILIHGGIFG